jgi:hypothetical protein
MGARQVREVGAVALLLALAAGCGRQEPASAQVEKHLYDLLRNHRNMTCLAEDGSGIALWVKQAQGRQLQGVLLQQHDARGNYGLVTYARDGEVRVDLSSHTLLIHLREGSFVCDGNTGHFDDRVLTFPFASASSRD